MQGTTGRAKKHKGDINAREYRQKLIKQVYLLKWTRNWRIISQTPCHQAPAMNAWNENWNSTTTSKKQCKLTACLWKETCPSIRSNVQRWNLTSLIIANKELPPKNMLDQRDEAVVGTLTSEFKAAIRSKRNRSLLSPQLPKVWIRKDVNGGHFQWTWCHGHQNHWLSYTINLETANCDQKHRPCTLVPISRLWT